MEIETYKVNARCSNCDVDPQVEIPKGQTYKDWVASHPQCPNCGCNSLVNKTSATSSGSITLGSGAGCIASF